MFAIYERKIEECETEVNTLETKLEETIFKDKDKVYKIEFTYLERISDNYIKVSHDNYEEIIKIDNIYTSNLVLGNKYYLIVNKVSNTNYRLFELNKLVSENSVFEIRGV